MIYEIITRIRTHLKQKEPLLIITKDINIITIKDHRCNTTQ